MSLRKLSLLVFLVACNADDQTSKSAPPDFGGGTDAFAVGSIDPAKVAALRERAQTFIKPGSQMQIEPRLAVPTVVWAKPALSVTPRARWVQQGVLHPEVTAARDALRNLAPLYNLSDDDVTFAHVEHVHTRTNGPTIVKLTTQIGGIEVFREELNVLLDRNLSPVTLTGYISSPQTPPARGGAMDFTLSPSQGVSRAIAHMTQVQVDPAQVSPLGTRDGYDSFNVANVPLADPIRVKRYYFHVPGGLEAAYYVEVSAYTGTLAPNVVSLDDAKPLESYGYLVSASTGQLLSRTNLVANETYRVWGDPTSKFPDDTASGHGQHPKLVPVPDGAQPPFVATNDITLTNFPFSQSATDPWLPPGATETNGNNVDAYVDLYTTSDGIGTPAPPADFPTGDFRAQATGAGQFLHTATPDVNTGTAEGRQAAIQQLFYNNNFLHDWYYDAGFNEGARNAQKNNFGRGGLGNDDIRAEVQDSSNLFNANMNTPADGGRPRMQMFNFPHPGNFLDAAVLGGKVTIGTAFIGAQQFSGTNELIPAAFTTPCALTNAPALAGKFALIDRNFTGCSLLQQLQLAQGAGATAIVMQNTGTTGITYFVGSPIPTITAPLVVVSNNNGAALRTAAPPVNVTIQRFADRDGALDQQIVFHEWMHYMSNRLIGNGNGLVSLQGGGMGEGWGDTNAMLLTVREEDLSVPSNANYNGVYALATHALGGGNFDGSENDSLYFGIRRYPYSTDMTKNPLTFTHIQDGVALPPGIPTFPIPVANSEVHNTGEVWATMLWECYAGMLRDTTGATPRMSFKTAQDRWRAYLVGGMKATPVAPTILEARDALLAFMLASDVDDYIACRKGFAKRGAGALATGPDRFSGNNTPVVEDFTAGPDLAFESASFDDSLGGCDNDGVVDHGEYGKLTVTVRNTGVEPLAATTLDVATTSAGMWFPSGTQAQFPAVGVGQTASASVRVALPPGSVGIQQVDFDVTATNAALAAPLNGIASFRVDTDDVLASSATDDVEANTTVWTRDFEPTLQDLAPWFRGEVTPLVHVFAVADPNGPTDERLLSPVFTVGPAGVFSVTFDHAWAFEFDGGGNYDGGVVEISVNNGPFTDFGASATAGGYNGGILAYAGNLNPLAGRQGFVQSSAGTTTTLTQNIAPGSSVQLRFRLGSDNFAGAGGWNVDNVAFSGVTQTPFATLVQDPDACAVVPTSADLAITKTDGVASVMPGGALTYTIVASNNGPGSVIGATVADTFPADLTCTWTCVGAGGGTCGGVGGPGNILDKPSLPSGGSTTYTASCTLSTTTALLSLSNTATIANPGPVTDPNLGNNSATDTDTIIRLPAHLVGTKTVAGTFNQGGTVTYTVILNNDGTGRQFDNTGDEFTDVLPAGLTLQSASATSGTAVATVGTNTVTWNGAINAGGNVTITIVATINAAVGTTISNQGSFAYDDDGNGTNNATGVTDAFPCP